MDDKIQSELDKLLEVGTVDELFHFYADRAYIYMDNMRTEKNDKFITFFKDALKDAFIAGIAVAILSGRSFLTEIVLHARSQMDDNGEVNQHVIEFLKAYKGTKQ